MAKNSLTKYELKIKIFSLINEIEYDSCGEEAKNVAKKYLDEVLFTILLDSL
jgi:hypothetical protein